MKIDTKELSGGYVILYNPNNSMISVVDNTLTADCSLNALSLDQMAQPRARAIAKYTTSSGSGDIRCASFQNPLNLSNDIGVIYSNNSLFINSNTLLSILDLESISSLCLSSSSSTYTEVNNSNSGWERINRLVDESFLKNENNTFASAINFIFHTYPLDNSFSIFKCTVLFTFLPNVMHFLSVMVLHLNNSSNNLINISFLNSSFTAFLTISDHSVCGNSCLILSGMTTFNSDIPITSNNIMIDYLNSFSYPDLAQSRYLSKNIYDSTSDFISSSDARSDMSYKKNCTFHKDCVSIVNDGISYAEDSLFNTQYDYNANQGEIQFNFTVVR